MRKKCTTLCTRSPGTANQYSIVPIGRTISTSSPLSSRTSRSAVCSIVSPGSGVPFGNTQVRSLSRPAITTSS